MWRRKWCPRPRFCVARGRATWGGVGAGALGREGEGQGRSASVAPPAAGVLMRPHAGRWLGARARHAGWSTCGACTVLPRCVQAPASPQPLLCSCSGREPVSNPFNPPWLPGARVRRRYEQRSAHSPILRDPCVSQAATVHAAQPAGDVAGALSVPLLGSEEAAPHLVRPFDEPRDVCDHDGLLTRNWRRHHPKLGGQCCECIVPDLRRDRWGGQGAGASQVQPYGDQPRG